MMPLPDRQCGTDVFRKSKLHFETMAKNSQQKYQKDSKLASEKSYATRTAIQEEAKSQYNDIYDRIASDSRYQKTKKK